jgi:hypothetical protein
MISDIGQDAELIGSAALVMEKSERGIPTKKKIFEAA